MRAKRGLCSITHAVIGLIGCMALASLCLTGAMAQTATSAREAAVLEARQGNLAGGIADLQALHAKYPSDPLIALDLATLLQQAGRSSEATDIFEQASVSAPPAYALAAVARAYRDQRRFDRAAALAADGAARFPDDPAWLILQALIAADQGHGAEALQLLALPAAQKAAPVPRLLAMAYAEQRAQMPMEALRDYMTVLHLDSGNREARSGAAALLRGMNGAYGAAALSDAPPPLTSGAARQSLAADEAAAMVRWGHDIPAPVPQDRFKRTDAALARLDQLIAAAQADAGDPALLRRLQIDRMLALRDRLRMNEVLQAAAALTAGGQVLPPYAREARADALLYLQHPKEAMPDYQAVLADDPSDLNARYGLFYAAVEAEDFTAAYHTIDELVAQRATWRRFVDDPSRYPDPDYSFAALTAAQARQYGDQLQEAEDRMAPLVAAAPANAAIRAANADLMQARGWPRQAETEAKIAESLDPIDANTEKTLASIDIARHRLGAAAERIRRLQALYPDDLSVQRLARELDAEQSALLSIEVSPNWTHGGGGNAQGNELTLSSRLWSPPIDDKWRAFAIEDYSYAHPEEGFVERNRTGGGIELRLPDVTVTAYGTYSTGELQQGGGGGSIEWWLDDHIALSLHGEVFSANTPLRALIADVTANEVGGAFTYRWSESRELTLSIGYLDYSDRNQQLSGGVDFSQRLIDIPHFDLTGRASVWGSGNRRDNVNYYSPKSDLTATAGLVAEHVLWRHYEDSLSQRFSIDGGVYAEQNFPAAAIGTIAYEQFWQLGPRTDFHYGVQLTTRVYDGDRENGAALTFGLNQRF
ncbi:MAG TPA: poly-beta-1,6 N-acetyl-D-glucosamine export porin PgaA [Terriglobales bacterium]|nr:poly-beta-1,6 N-acetyl-D-glucosamine export porin PgaA [Terriglobales bacterium]